MDSVPALQELHDLNDEHVCAATRATAKQRMSNIFCGIRNAKMSALSQLLKSTPILQILPQKRTLIREGGAQQSRRDF